MDIDQTIGEIIYILTRWRNWHVKHYIDIRDPDDELTSMVIGVVDHIDEVLKMINDAQTNEERLNAALIAARVRHTSGCRIVEDDDFLWKICEEGFTSVFSKDQIRAYISG